MRAFGKLHFVLSKPVNVNNNKLNIFYYEWVWNSHENKLYGLSQLVKRELLTIPSIIHIKPINFKQFNFIFVSLLQLFHSNLKNMFKPFSHCGRQSENRTKSKL